jgi:hypothetical protein
MRAIRKIVYTTSKRGDDMPLYGSITRVKKGLYEVVIKFTASKRILHAEQIGAPDKAAVKQFFRREYPTLTWGKPKYPKPIRHTNPESKSNETKRRGKKDTAGKLTRKGDEHGKGSRAARRP